MPPAGGRNLDGAALEANGDARARRDLADLGQAQTPARRLSLQGLCGAGRTGQGDLIVVAAGGESTTSLLGTAVRILAERPDLQDRLRADRTLLPAFVEEALRYDPPFRGHYRVVTQDTVLGETPLPAGAHLVLAWPAANRDDAAYERPDEVQLDVPTLATTSASGGASTSASAPRSHGSRPPS